MGPHLDRAARTGRSQVAAIGVAQEFASVWTARKRDTDPAKPPQFSFTKQQRRVTVFYVYLWADDFGPAFIKLCSWFPYPIKLWVNGHEWAKRQATKAGIGFTELSNGFATCDQPRHCRPSATGSAPARSACSSNGGPRGCRCRFPPPTATPGSGGT